MVGFAIALPTLPFTHATLAVALPTLRSLFLHLVLIEKWWVSLSLYPPYILPMLRLLTF